MTGKALYTTHPLNLFTFILSRHTSRVHKGYFIASKREKKLGRATKNLYKLQGDTFFFSHEEIYGEWERGTHL